MIEEQERCMAMAEPLLGDFHDAWHHALGTYQSYPAELTAEHDDTTAANCIRGHMWTEVVRRFDGRPGCRLMRLRGLNLLSYKDEALWRFKRVDGAGRHANYQTQQQQDYDDQIEFPELPSAAVRLTSGYQPDKAGQSIERVIIAQPMGRSVVWTSQINVLNGAVSWTDITPARLSVADRVDFRGRRRR